jgi:hypothetical protein
VSKCARPDCHNAGTKSCSICLREHYCSGECQKGDWKSHKIICKIIKKLSLKLQPYHEVYYVIKEVRNEISTNQQQKSRVLEHFLSYAEHQFGDRVPGKAYRERLNGERYHNWRAEINLLCTMYNNLANSYKHDAKLLGTMATDNLVFPYYEKMLELLRPWTAYLDLNCTNHIDGLDEDQINYTLYIFSTTELYMDKISILRYEWNLAENYCQRALSFARLYGEEETLKIELLCAALKVFYMLRSDQGNYDDALIFVEEACNCVAIAYNPVHPKVQGAASTLIECLIFKGDFKHAETFAQMTLDSLKDSGNGLGQQSEAVAKGYYDLGYVIDQQEGDYVKAEMLSRESLRIRSRLYNNDHFDVGISASLLANILQS